MLAVKRHHPLMRQQHPLKSPRQYRISALKQGRKEKEKREPSVLTARNVLTDPLSSDSIPDGPRKGGH